MYDVLIIGAGVTGCAVARELSRYEIRIGVLEREEDVCAGTSKANSAIIHAGFDAPEGSMMAKMNVRGNEMMDQLTDDLDIPFRRNGAMVVCAEKERIGELLELYRRGLANGVPQDSMKLLSREEAQALEPNLSDQVIGAFYAGTSGIICPFTLNVALAENACANGCEFFFDTEVKAMQSKTDEAGGERFWNVVTDKGTYTARYVVNAAGVYADELHNMVSSHKIHITPRRGEYLLLDRNAGHFVEHTIFPQPTKLGKGVLVLPTIHGNLLVGPTAEDISDREGTETTADGLKKVIEKAGNTVKNIPLDQVITSFSGLRAHEDHHEFILEENEDAPQFIDCAGIESPGLSACPAIGEYIAGMLKEKMGLKEKENWIQTRKGILNPAHLTFEERQDLIRRQPAYGRIICRCESVSEGEIIDAIRRPIGAKSLDGIKRRVRAGSGRCQAGFCAPRVMEILSRERALQKEAITKSGKGSELVFRRTKIGAASSGETSGSLTQGVMTPGETSGSIKQGSAKPGTAAGSAPGEIPFSER
jgi:glycerol-3-phosphate dehydrogenase